MELVRNIALVSMILFSAFGEANPIVPDSLDAVLAEEQTDSALSVRAELAYARGLYHLTKELLERIQSPTQKDILLLGQTCHVLAEPFAARGYFSRITEPDLMPMAQVGLAELYCGDIPDKDSCELYRGLVGSMDYLKRFVELTLPVSASEVTLDEDISDEGDESGVWTLQFGAFSMRSLADQMAVKVKKEGLKPLIVPRERDGETMFFVFGGSFRTKGEAAAQADALAKEFACKIVTFSND